MFYSGYFDNWMDYGSCEYDYKWFPRNGINFCLHFWIAENYSQSEDLVLSSISKMIFNE